MSGVAGMGLFEANGEAERERPAFRRASLPAAARLGGWLVPLVLFIVDYIMVVLAFKSVAALRAAVLPRFMPDLSGFSLGDRFIYYIFPLIYVGLISYEGLYGKRLPIWKCAEKLFRVCCYAVALIIGALFFSKNANWFSRILLGLSGPVAFAYLIAARYTIKRLLNRLGLWANPVLVVGAGKTAELLARAFEDEPNLGYKIVGFIDDRPVAEGSYLRQVLPEPVIGSFAQIEEVIAMSGVREVIIAAPGLGLDKLVGLANRIQPLVKRLIVVPNLIGMPMSNMEVETLFKQKTIMLAVRNNLAEPRNRFYKRLFDLAVGGVIFVLSVPAMLLIALAIRLESRGPALFVGKRIGKGGREFDCYKFRSMYVDGDAMLETFFAQNAAAREDWEKFAKIKTEDPRVTRVGRILRRLSLDELPQIINVLKGDMSLVGPRPYLPRERKKMGSYYNAITETVPGVTGLWQTSGRNDVAFEDRLQMDEWYVRNWSVWLDMAMMVRTVGVVCGRRGAY